MHRTILIILFTQAIIPLGEKANPIAVSSLLLSAAGTENRTGLNFGSQYTTVYAIYLNFAHIFLLTPRLQRDKVQESHNFPRPTA